MTTRRLAALMLAALAAAGPSEQAEAEAESTPVEVARNEAESNAKSPAGKRYEGVFVSRAEDWLRPALERCVKDVPEIERISFDALVRVSPEGKPGEVLFGPETALARCVAPDFRDATYPRPPQPDWWVKIIVRMK